jgi:hypothetical protein
MTAPHDHWDELAAGYALNALEPDEVEAFHHHVDTCSRCRAAVADHAFVAAQLGTVVSVDDEAPSWDRIRGGILPHGHVPAPLSLDAARARRRAPRLVTAAAALLLVAGAAAATVISSSGRSQNAQEGALAACRSTPGCHVVRLQGKAELVVADGEVRVLPTSLTAAPAGRIYVLWQLPRAGRPTMVAGLTTTSRGSVGEPHRLVLAYASTAAFGISLEAASEIPAAPTDIVALGQT